MSFPYSILCCLVHQALFCISDVFDLKNKPELNEVVYYPHFTERRNSSEMPHQNGAAMGLWGPQGRLFVTCRLVHLCAGFRATFGPLNCWLPCALFALFFKRRQLDSNYKGIVSETKELKSWAYFGILYTINCTAFVVKITCL